MSAKTVRLDRLLANLGYGSRREVQALASAGVIHLDGAPVTDAAGRLAADADLPARLTVQGREIDPLPGLCLMLHKPLGVTCSHKEAGPLVYGLLRMLMSVLTQVRSLLPAASLSLLGYFNPFPADPASPAAPIFNAGGVHLNGIIKDLAAQFGASFVDTATPFLGHEAQYTYLDEMPHGSSVGGAFGGTLPIGNVHPNAEGYAAIAAAVSGVPEPAEWVSLASGLMALVLAVRVRRPTR